MEKVLIKPYQLGKYVVTSDKLGSGTFADVFLAYEQGTKIKLAVKIMKSKQFEDRFKKNEVELLSKVQSQNIVKLYDVKKCRTGENHMFLQYCQTNLKNEIESKIKNGQVFNENHVINIIRQICNGYKKLYQNKIIHRDIKPENILIHKGVYKLSDFGLGRFVQNMDDKTKKTLTGSPTYTAPEILQRKQYNSKIDIWSLGIVLYQLLYYKTPFNFKTIQQVVSIIPKIKIVIPDFIDRPKHLCDLLLKMLKIQQKQRIDWPQLFTQKIFLDSQQLDMQQMSSIQKVQKMLKFYMQISNFINKILQYFCQLQSLMTQQTHMFGVLALASYSLYVNKMSVQSFFYKQYPDKSITLQQWQTYKQTNSYWQLLKQTKRKENLLLETLIDMEPKFLSQNFNDDFLKQSSGKLIQIINIDARQYDVKCYLKMMEWVIKEMKNNDELEFMIKYMEMIKNPLNYFNIETNFENIYRNIQEEFNQL